MKKFKVVIEETLSEEFSIEAETPEVAQEAAIQQYLSGEIVLEPGNVEETKIQIIDDDGTISDWTTIQQ